MDRLHVHGVRGGGGLRSRPLAGGQAGAGEMAGLASRRVPAPMAARREGALLLRHGRNDGRPSEDGRPDLRSGRASSSRRHPGRRCRTVRGRSLPRHSRRAAVPDERPVEAARAHPGPGELASLALPPPERERLDEPAAQALEPGLCVSRGEPVFAEDPRATAASDETPMPLRGLPDVSCRSSF